MAQQYHIVGIAAVLHYDAVDMTSNWFTAELNDQVVYVNIEELLSGSIPLAHPALQQVRI